MSNKWLAAILITGTIIIVSAVIYLRKPSELGIPTINAVPADAAVVIKANGILSLLAALDDNSWWQSVPDVQLKSQLNSLRQSFDSICQESVAIRDVLSDSSIYIAICGSAKETASVSFSIPFDPSAKSEKVKEIVADFCSALHMNSYEYVAGKNIAQPATDNRICWYFFVDKGLIVISNSLKTIDNSFHQLKRRISLVKDTSFAKVFNTSGKNVSASIFINNTQAVSLVSKWLKPEYAKTVRSAIEVNGWTAVDYTIDAQTMAFHGFTVRAKESSLLMQILKVEQPAESSFIEAITNSAVGFVSVAFSEPYNFKATLKEFLKANPKEKDKIVAMRNNMGFEADNKLSEIFGEAVVMVLAPSPDNLYNKYCIIKTQSGMDAIDFVNRCKKSFTNDKAGKKQKSKNDSDSLIVKTVYAPLAYSNLPGLLFGDIFKDKYTSIANFNEYLILGPSESQLSAYINSLNNKKTIASDSEFLKSTAELFASKSNISIVLNVNKIWNCFGDWVTPETFSYASEHFISKASYTLAGFQFSGNGEYIYNNGFVYTASGNVISGPEQNWFVATDTAVVMAPQQISMNRNRESYIAFQDKNNTLYFVSMFGKLLWKKKLNDKILGCIYGIDYFKNGKTQLLFNTAKGLFLLDKNGKSIKGFPVSFKRQATNGLALADFDANLNYRYYLAFENNSFIALTKEGRKVEGWSFEKSNSTISQTAQCFTFQDKDYVVFRDTSRIYLLNRKGEERLKLKEQINFSVNSKLIIDLRTKYFRFITTDNLGQVISVFPDGHLETEKLGVFSSNCNFEMVDLNSDGNKDFIFADDSSIIAFNQEKKVLFNSTISGNVGQLFPISNSENTVLFAFSDSSNLLYKFNSEGSLAKGFPIKCNYSINFLSLCGNQNNRLLVVAGSVGVSGFSFK